MGMDRAVNPYRNSGRRKIISTCCWLLKDFPESARPGRV